MAGGDGFCWAKHYAGMITDDKFVAAADIAGVNPLLPPVVFSALFERAIENRDGGSFAGFRPRVLAAKFRVAVEEVERTLAAFAELAIVEGERLVNWAKRQGAAAIAAVSRLSTPRVRRHRARERDLRQGEMLLPIAGGAGETVKRVSPVSSVSDGVSPSAETANPRGAATASAGTADRDRDSDTPLSDSPQPPTRWGAQHNRGREGRGSRALGTNPRAQRERDERQQAFSALQHEAKIIAEIVDHGARERQAGRWDDARMPQHLAAIRARQAELFGLAA